MLCKKTLPGLAVRARGFAVSMMLLCVYYRKASMHFNHEKPIIYVETVFLSCSNSTLPEKWKGAPQEAALNLAVTSVSAVGKVRWRGFQRSPG